MKVYPKDQTTLIVHPGTGTIIDADEVVLLNMDDTVDWPEEHELIETAEDNNETLDNLHVVVLGNVFDGVRLVGPFLSFDDAALWADEKADRENWVTGLLSTTKWEAES